MIQIFSPGLATQTRMRRGLYPRKPYSLMGKQHGRCISVWEAERTPGLESHSCHFRGTSLLRASVSSLSNGDRIKPASWDCCEDHRG